MNCRQFLFSFLFLLNVHSFDFFSARFIDQEDSCTDSNLMYRIGEGVIKVRKNLLIPQLNQDISFHLYTQKNPKKSQKLILNDKNSVKHSNFNKKKPVRILVHGFQNSVRHCFSVIVRNAYTRKGDFNVIAVDWSMMASRTYLQAVNWAPKIAKIINDFTIFLHKEFGIAFENIYLIGHSLGAQIVGMAGKQLKSSIGKYYDTIFGLDPAGPAFEKIQEDNVIRAGDAKYVETIHTNMGVYGYKGQLGDASVYPNYGNNQKDCYSESRTLPRQACSHVAVYYYFAKSLDQPKSMVAKRCNSYDEIQKKNCKCDKSIHKDCNSTFYIGGDPSTKKIGVFYVDI